MATDAISGLLTQQSQRSQSINRLESSATLTAATLSKEEHSAQQIQSLQPLNDTEVEKKSMMQLVDDLNDVQQYQQRAIQFSVDEDAGRPVIKIIDSETDKVIRQIPQEEVLRFQQRMQEMSGAILQEQA